MGDQVPESKPGRISPYATPSATREVLERHGLYTKYALGQNFLVNDDVVRKILQLAAVDASDFVLEVGPGIGTLSAALLQHAAHVTSVEMDRDLPAVLAQTLAPWTDRFSLLQMDALNVQVEDLAHAENLRHENGNPQIAERSELHASSAIDVFQAIDKVFAADAADATDAADAADTTDAQKPSARESISASISKTSNKAPLPNKLVSNLPYAVAATVVLDYLQRFDFLESATVMVQKEVADRMMAKPGSKAYGAYTVKLALIAKPAGRFSVAPGNFFPPPHVESTVIRLNRVVANDEFGKTLSAEDLCAAATMADAAFATRRKTLANSCKMHFAGDSEMQAQLPRLFEIAGVNAKNRGETLSPCDFIRMGKALIQLRSE